MPNRIIVLGVVLSITAIGLTVVAVLRPNMLRSPADSRSVTSAATAISAEPPQTLQLPLATEPQGAEAKAQSSLEPKRVAAMVDPLDYQAKYANYTTEQLALVAVILKAAAHEEATRLLQLRLDSGLYEAHIGNYHEVIENKHTFSDGSPRATMLQADPQADGTVLYKSAELHTDQCPSIVALLEEADWVQKKAESDGPGH